MKPTQETCMSLSDQDKQAIAGLRERGFAVIVFSPDELGGNAPEAVEAELVMAANNLDLVGGPPRDNRQYAVITPATFKAGHPTHDVWDAFVQEFAVTPETFNDGIPLIWLLEGMPVVDVYWALRALTEVPPAVVRQRLASLLLSLWRELDLQPVGSMRADALAGVTRTAAGHIGDHIADFVHMHRLAVVMQAHRETRAMVTDRLASFIHQVFKETP